MRLLEASTPRKGDYQNAARLINQKLSSQKKELHLEAQLHPTDLS